MVVVVAAVPNKRKVVINTVIYVWVCLFQTALALAISHGGVAAINAITGGSANAWSADRLLTFVAGVGLLAYGAFLGKEWYEENYGEGSGGEGGGSDEEGGSKPEGSASAKKERGVIEESSPLILSAEKREAAGLPPLSAEEPPKDGRTSSSLFVVAFLGSLDDLTLFVPMFAYPPKSLFFVTTHRCPQPFPPEISYY